MLNIHHIVHETSAEGPGTRCCVWLQGCSIHCDGCFAPDTWSFDVRRLMAPSDILAALHPAEEGITVLGGEPFDQCGQLAELVTGAHVRGLSTIVFTGYTYESLLERRDPLVDAVLAHTDVLIDGPFDRALLQDALPLIGSSNQQFRFLTDRYTLRDFLPNRLEVRVMKNGAVSINGMASGGLIGRLRKL